MKKINLILVLAFISGCVNFAFGQCTITGNFENGREVNGSLINDHPLSLIKGKKFYVEVNIKNLSNIGGYNPFKIYFPNTGNDLSNPGLTDFRRMILNGILKDDGNVAYSFGSEDYSENDWQRTRESTLDTLSVESKQIRVLVSSGTHPRGKYTIKVYSEGCNTNGSSGSSGNNSNGSKPAGNSNDDGSIDIGKAILDKIKERRNKDKKPKENSGGNDNNSNNFGSGVTIFEGKNQSGTSATFGIGAYAANFGPIKAIGNDTASSISVENGYRVKICQHEGNNNQGSGNCEEYGAGSYNLKYDNQASWIKVWKDGSSSGSSGSNSSNSSNPKSYKDDKGNNVKYLLGDLSFADKVVSFKKGSPAPSERNANSNNALGKPDYNEARDEENYVTLGCGGILTVEFVDNVLVDGNGNDLFVYEIGPNIESTKVEISKDNRNWINVGSVSGKTSSLDIGKFVNPNDEFRFVRLTDEKTACNGGYPGADIDAIGAISSRNISGGNSTGSNDNPPNDIPYDPNNQTGVKLYLYKLGKADNPNCNTGLTAVSMSITKQSSMLRATLEELFRYPKIQRGYSNFTSEISLKEVKISNGTAIIYVTGYVDQGCESTRFISQITSTAKQYSTIKNVRIFLNDVEFTGR